MALKLNDKYIKPFLAKEDLTGIAPQVKAAGALIREKNGLGSDFLGWVDLPVNYDKEEFARIKAAAERIKKSCDILVVIGIGGSYLGARAAIEFVKSPSYNELKKDTPSVYFAGNNICSSALAELLELCEGQGHLCQRHFKVGHYDRAGRSLPYFPRAARGEVRRGGRARAHLCNY